MKRIYFTYLGLALVATILIVFALASEGLAGSALLAVVALALGADLFVIGGLTEEVSINSWEVQWYRFVGTGTILLGLSMIAFTIDEMVSVDGISVGAATFAFAGGVVILIGADFFRGGLHYDLSAVE